jgi:NAD(P)-dependent dehydrogenase (short-subunit alcohol dehydrogenase family)
MKDKEYSGKHVVVTGGGSGIGRALALAFAAQGAEVTITDIEQQRVDEVLAELKQKGGKASGYRVDHSSEEETRLFAEKLLGGTTAPDVVCANAGVAEGSPLDIANMADWRWVMDINVMGVAYTLRYLLPAMIERGSGSVLITASGAALVPGPGMASYHASKAAACSLGESLSIELAPKGINVSVLCPGIIKTAIAKDSRIHFGDEAEDMRVAANGVRRYEADDAVDPSVVARDALHGLRKNKLIICSPWSHVGPGWLLHRLAPAWFNKKVVLPKWRKGELINGIKIR